MTLVKQRAYKQQFKSYKQWDNALDFECSDLKIHTTIVTCNVDF